MEENPAHPRLTGELGLMREYAIEDRTIEACQSGDADAFRLLFENYKDRVYSIALGYFNGDEASARDITQTVFLKLMTHISTFQNRSEFSTWLYRMVANACLDQKRALRRLLFFGDTREVAFPDRRKSAEERYIARELEAEVRKAIAGLRPRLRIAILLKYFDDLSYEEIAAALGCSPGTVASRLNRGHRILARKLAHLRSAAASGELGE
jgi:RNA polymerase sigma-70 factor (ECF subfamily)